MMSRFLAAALLVFLPLGVDGFIKTFCGCNATVPDSSSASSSVCYTGMGGSCNTSLLSFSDDCFITCPPGKRTFLVAKVTQYAVYDFFACQESVNGAFTIVNSTGQSGPRAFSGFSCLTLPACDACPVMNATDDCPPNNYCDKTQLAQKNRNDGCNQMMCNHGIFTIKSSNGTWLIGASSVCSTYAKWANTTNGVGSAGYGYWDANATVTCSRPKATTQCPAPIPMLDVDISVTFKESYQCDSTKLVITNYTMDGARVGCASGWILQGFSASEPSNAALAFLTGSYATGTIGRIWSNMGNSFLPLDVKFTCVLKKATCINGCVFQKKTGCTCETDNLTPVVGSSDCTLGCPEGYRVVGGIAATGEDDVYSSLTCGDGKWAYTSMYNSTVLSLGTSVFAGCEVDLLFGCPVFTKWSHHGCSVRYLKWDIETQSMSCTEGSLVADLGVVVGGVSVGVSMSSISYVNGYWAGISVQTGVSIHLMLSKFTCDLSSTASTTEQSTTEESTTAISTTESEIIRCNATEPACNSCFWFVYKHDLDEPKEACDSQSGVLTLAYLDAKICNVEIEAFALSALYCKAGAWYYIGAAGVRVDIDGSNPFEPCLGSTATPEIESTVSDVSASTETEIRRCNATDAACNSCFWFVYKHDLDEPKEACDSQSGVLTLAYLDAKICNVEIEAFALSALYCKAGAWYYIGAAGVRVDIDGSNPFEPCLGSTATPEIESTVSDVSASTETEIRRCNATDAACNSCFWFVYKHDLDEPKESCDSQSGVLTLAYLDAKICNVEIEAFALSALYCKAGAWYYIGAAGVRVDIDGSNPFEPCLGSTATPEIESTVSDVSASTETEIRRCNATDAACNSCFWFVYKHDLDEPKEACDSQSGVLTLAYLDAKICNVEIEAFALSALYCKAGAWYYIGAAGVRVDIDGSNPFEPCLGSTATPEIESTVSDVSASTETEIRRCNATDAACNSCFWFVYKHDLDEPKEACDSQSGVLTLAYLDAKICNVEIEAFALSALYCKAGAWYYIGAAGVRVDIDGSNPFEPCLGSTATPEIESTVSDVSASTETEIRRCNATDAACNSCFWFVYKHDLDEPKESCDSQSGVLTLAYLDAKICNVEIEAFALSALYCKAGAWYYIGAAGVRVDIDGSNPFEPCLGSTATPEIEPTVSDVSTTSSECPVCTCVDAGGDKPISKDCVENQPVITCEVGYELEVLIGEVFVKYSTAVELPGKGWLAFDCTGRAAFIEIGVSLTVKCVIAAP